MIETILVALFGPNLSILVVLFIMYWFGLRLYKRM